MALTKEEIENYGSSLIQLLPKDGTPKGNKSLIQEFNDLLKKREVTLTPDDYWEIRNSLIAKGLVGKGKGKGGSVYLLTGEPKKEAAKRKRRKSEKDLYEPFMKVLNDFWVKDNQIKNFVIENTGKGKKRTPGKWTRPDITLVTVKTYAFTPGKILEVITFEIKQALAYDVSGVFETAAHSVFANKSYLAIESSDELKESEEFDRLQLLCKRFGVGLLLFTDVNDWETYEEIVDPERKLPDPGDINTFLSTHFSKEKQNTILEMLK